MKFTKILLATLSLAFIQSCSNNDDEIIELNKKELQSSREIDNKFKLKLRIRIKTINKALLNYHYPNEN